MDEKSVGFKNRGIAPLSTANVTLPGDRDVRINPNLPVAEEQAEKPFDASQIQEDAKSPEKASARKGG